MRGRRTAWSPLWWWPCPTKIKLQITHLVNTTLQIPCIADYSGRWATIGAEASVGVTQWRLSVKGVSQFSFLARYPPTPFGSWSIDVSLLSFYPVSNNPNIHRSTNCFVIYLTVWLCSTAGTFAIDNKIEQAMVITFNFFTILWWYCAFLMIFVPKVAICPQLVCLNVARK